MTTPALTRTDLQRTLGDVADEEILANIVALGATQDELSQAVAEVEYEDDYGEALEKPSRPIVQRLKGLVRAALDQDKEERFVRGYD